MIWKGIVFGEKLRDVVEEQEAPGPIRSAWSLVK